MFKHVKKIEVPEKKMNSVRINFQRSQCRISHKRKDC